MSAPQLKTLISGAGIAGSCLAFWLSKTRLNTSIKIVERSPVPRITGQAVDVRGPAIEVIKKMKLEEALRSRHTTETGATFFSPSGKPFARFDGRSGDSLTAEFEILRADLSQLFLEASENFNNVQYVYGDSIKNLEQADDHVDVTFAGGSKESFDLVVAADGSTSKTRSMFLDELTLKDSYRFLGQYHAFFSIPSQPTDTKLWKWFSAPKGLAIMIRPHRNPSTMGAYLAITTPARGKRDPIVEEALRKGTADTKRMLHQYFQNLGWEAKRVLEGMDSADDFYMSPMAKVEIPKWTNHHALAIGDAAFATFGVGTSLAILSAYVLAGELSKISSSSSPTTAIPLALQSYEAAFRPLVDEIGNLIPGYPQIICPQSRWALGLRNLIVWISSKTGLFKTAAADSKTKWKLPEYEWVGL